ncbi:MAG: hypothetical protein ACYCTB_11355 [bacterium]
MNIFSKFYDWIADDDSDNDEKVGWKDVDWGKAGEYIKEHSKKSNPSAINSVSDPAYSIFIENIWHNDR